MKDSSETLSKPTLAFVARNLGYDSEVWLWRQLVGFKRLNPHVLTWIHTNRKIFPTNGIRVHHIDFAPNPQDAPGLGRWVFRIRNLPRMNFFASIGKEEAHIRRLFEKIRPDVILCHFGWMGIRILPLAKKMEIPVVVHFHGQDLSSALNNHWYRWSLIAGLRSFANAIVVNNEQRLWLNTHGMADEKISVIPCGVPVDQYSNTHKKDSSIINFITVSRLVEKKGLDYTLRSFHKIVSKFPDSRLKIAGDGPLRDNLESLASKLNLQSTVKFIGTMDPETVRRLLSNSDVFLQHSVVPPSGDKEGSSVSIAEAAASGLPVVTTIGCGGTEELVSNGETGYLVKQRDVTAMAEAMLKLARDPELRAKMGRAGRERMVKHFDTKKQITQLEEVLLRCCRKS